MFHLFYPMVVNGCSSFQLALFVGKSLERT